MINPQQEPPGVKMAPKAVVGRMSLYLRQLEAYQRPGHQTISSSKLGEPLSIKNAQVRKDLAFFGQFGHPGIGYRIDELIDALRHILGIDHDWPLALVGLEIWAELFSEYRGFRNRGFHVVALFDNDPGKIGQKHDGLIVEPIEALRKAVALAEDQAGDLVRSHRSRPACGRPAGRLRDRWHSELCPGSPDRTAARQPRARRPQRAARNLAYKVQKTLGEVSTSCAG